MKVWLYKLMRGYLAPLSLVVFLFILSPSSVKAEIATSSVVWYYDFDNGTGHDFKNQPYAETTWSLDEFEQGGTSVDYSSSGKFGGAIYSPDNTGTSGASSKYYYNASVGATPYETPETFSYSFWYKDSASPAIFSSLITNWSAFTIRWFADNTLKLDYRNSANSWASTDCAGIMDPDDTWHNIIIQGTQGGTVDFYADGTLICDNVGMGDLGNHSDNGYGLAFLANGIHGLYDNNNSGTAWGYSGYLDDFALLNRELDTTEITAIQTQSIKDYITNGDGTSGLSFTEVQYNPVTGNVFLAGTCVKAEGITGYQQMDLDASTNFDPETLTWDSIDPLRSSLVRCMEDNTFTALYNGLDLTGTTTLIMDDTFYGTQIITTDVNFYEATGFIKFNWGDLITISTLQASGTPVSLPFTYDVCGDPDYNATSSYIYLATDTVGQDGSTIHTLNYSSPRVQIPTCSGSAHIDFTMPYNSIFEGEAYFAYANTYTTIILKSKVFYIFAKPKTLKDGTDVMFGNSNGTDTCTPPSYNLDVICAGIPSTTLGISQCAFKYGLVTAGQFLFVPSCASRKFITDQFYKFKSAFPFSAFYDLTDTMDQAIVSAQNSTSTIEGISMPFIRKTSTSTEYYMMPLATSTSFSNLIGQNNYNTYLTTLGYVWWVIVAGAIFFIIWKV